MSIKPKCSAQSSDCYSVYVKHANLCYFHYNRKRNSRELTARKNQPRIDSEGNKLPCRYPGCPRPLHRRGYCFGHAKQEAAKLPLTGFTAQCEVFECEEIVTLALGGVVCRKHRQQAWRFNISQVELVKFWGKGKCWNFGCENIGNLHMDHDHSCCPPGKYKRGKHSCGNCVRGMLCKDCNTTLGQMKESPRKIRGLANYLNRTEIKRQSCSSS